MDAVQSTIQPLSNSTGALANGARGPVDPLEPTSIGDAAGQTNGPATGSRASRTPPHVFGEIVSLLNESPKHRHLFLSDLEWFVVPPMRLGQFRLVYARERLIAFASWARVSEHVDRELEQGRTRLKPDEWNAGDRLWLIDVIAPSLTMDAEGAAKLLSTLARDAFGGRPFKLWRLNPVSGRPEAVVFASNSKDSPGVKEATHA